MRKSILSVIFLSTFTSNIFCQREITLSEPQNGLGYVENKAGELVRFTTGYQFKATASDWMKGYLDESLTVIQDGFSVSSLVELEIETDKIVGKTEINTSVNPNGSSNVNIPLSVPSSSNGLTPEIYLNYNSYAGCGFMGLGWSISGLFKITTTTQTVYHNTTSKGFSLDGNDVFLLNGQRLIPNFGEVNGAEGTEYRTELETYQQIFSYGEIGNLPESFIVNTKDGYVYEYGGSEDYYRISQSSSLGPDGVAIPVEWFLKKITDRNGNKIVYNYNSENKDLVESIEYGINGESSPLYSIKFEYSDIDKTFKKGRVDFLQDYDKLLFKINTFVGENLHRSYKLQYQDTYGYQLNELTEFGSDGSSFNSTKFKYGDKKSHSKISGVSDLGVNLNGNLHPNDFNNDGITDLLITYPKEMSNWNVRLDRMKVFLGSTSGKFTEVYDKELIGSNYDYFYSPLEDEVIGNQTQINSDFNGDGFGDFMIVNYQPFQVTENTFSADGSGTGSRTANYQKITGISFFINNGTDDFIKKEILIPEGISSTKFGQGISIGDFNGDGETDVYLALNNLNSYDESKKESFDLKTQGYLVLYKKSAPILVSSYFPHSIAMDIEGDGKYDIYKTGSTRGSGPVAFDIQFNSSVTSAEFKAKSKFYRGMPFRYFDDWNIDENGNINILNKVQRSEVYLGDFNGDGKTDGFSIDLNQPDGSNSATLGLSDGINLRGIYNTQSLIHKQANLAKDFFFRSGDFDGDGKTDLAYITRPKTSLLNYSAPLTILYSQGDFYDRIEVIDNFYIDRNGWYVGDFNGDGIDDIMSSTSLYLMNNGGEQHLLKEALDGLGVLYKFEYGNYIGRTNPISSSIEIDSKTYKKNIKRKVTKRHSIRRKMESFKDNTFEYGDVIFHKEGLGLLGVTNHKVIDNNQNTISSKTFKLDNKFYRLWEYRNITSIKSDESIILNERVNEFQFIQTGGYLSSIKYKKELKNSLNKNYVKDFETFEEYLYDADGNAVKYDISYGRIGKEIIESHTTETFFKKENTWIASSKDVERTTKKRTGSEMYIREIEYPDYDSKGNLLTKITDPDDVNQLTIKYAYNNAGQITSKTTIAKNDNGSEVPQHQEKYFFNTSFQLLKSQNNALQEKEFTYDNLGREITQTGLDKLVTSFNYDAFGRITETILPTGVSTQKQLLWNIIDADNKDIENISTIYSEKISAVGSPTYFTDYDAFNRTKIEIKIEDGEEPIKKTTAYLTNGLVKFTSLPYYNTSDAVVISKEYDIFNRVISDKTDGLTPTLYTYYNNLDGYNIETESPIGKKTIISDPTDKTIKVIDNSDNELNFDFYSSGLLKTTKLKTGALEQTLSELKYDLQGNKIELNDKNAGITVYNYNSFGQLVLQNNNSKIKRYTYDLLGRIKSEVKPEGKTFWEYENEGSAINKVKSISNSNDISLINEYEDEFGRLSKKTEIIDTEVLETSFEVNNLGQITSVQYPSGFKIKNLYSNSGELVEIRDYDLNKMIWKKESKNSFGLPTQYVLGNGKTTNISYDEYGYYNSINVEGIYEENYLFDKNRGNLLSRQDNISSNFEAFEYDEHDRLSKVYTNDILEFNSINYFENGNIKEKSEIGIYEYDSDKINAVNKITAPFGKQPINTHDQLIPDYTSFNKIKSIDENGKKIEFKYGVDEERKVVRHLDEGVLSYTKYYSDNFEKIVFEDGTIEQTCRINSPYGTIAFAVKKNEVSTKFYSYNDYLGSPLVITDESGIIIHNQNFDAWGRKRNPSNLTYNEIPITPNWLRGFTGHEYYSDFELINMNGRIYDPVISRFLSPDNFIQDETNVQNYNRYSYTWNNPLKYTDPTGYTVAHSIPAMHGGMGQPVMSGITYEDPSGIITKGDLYSSGVIAPTLNNDFFKMGSEPMILSQAGGAVGPPPPPAAAGVRIVRVVGAPGGAGGGIAPPAAAAAPPRTPLDINPDRPKSRIDISFGRNIRVLNQATLTVSPDNPRRNLIVAFDDNSALLVNGDYRIEAATRFVIYRPVSQTETNRAVNAFDNTVANPVNNFISSGFVFNNNFEYFFYQKNSAGSVEWDVVAFPTRHPSFPTGPALTWNIMGIR